MIAYVKRFIPDCITLKELLLELLEKVANFDWAPIRDFNFFKLKQKMMLAPIMQYPMRDSNYQMENNASDAALGDMLRILKEKD